MKFNVNLHPKDGYFFKEHDGSTLRAENWTGVIARVIDYRKRNGLPAGEPEKEVMAQACARNPSLCREETQSQRDKRRVVSLKGRMLSWLSALRAKMAKAPLEFVGADEYASRRDVCAACPQNTALPDGCSSCRAAVREMRKELLGPSREISANLHGCAILGHDCAVAAHLDEQRVENPDLPANCWRKRVVPSQ